MRKVDNKLGLSCAKLRAGLNFSGLDYILIYFSFLFLFPVVYFSHRRSARIKKLILRKLTGAPKNLGVDTFPDPVSHFGAP